MKVTHLRTRFALTLAALAALTALGVGVLGFRWTQRRFTQEIILSLDRYADEVESDPGFAAGQCNGRRLIPTAPVARRGDDASLSPDRFGQSGNTDDATNQANDDANETTDDGRRRPPRRRRFDGDPRRPPGVIVQCISNLDTITPQSRAITIPVSKEVRKLARSNQSSRSFAKVRIDEERFQVLTVGLKQGGAIQIARQISESEGILRTIRTELAVLTAAATAIAGILGWWLAGRTAKPIVALTTTVEAVTASGRFDTDVPVSYRKDETGRLTQSFQSMIHSLRASKAQQDRLIHDASHELRTPLTSMRANIGLLRKYDRLTEVQRNSIVGDLDSELRELTDLVNELVALAEDWFPDEALTTLDVTTLVTDVAQRWGRRSERHISVSAPDEPIVILGKPRCIDRAINNVINNAVKFSPADSPVEVVISNNEKSFTVTVSDRGPGFPEAELTRVFERFYRSDLHRGLPGSGLGLAIVEACVKEAGGTVRAANRQGGGGEITIEMPTSRSNEPDVRP